MSTTSIGQAAEMAAAEQLIRDGFTILERNWRTKWCEVDIIASKADVVWFIEVKYRQTDHFGDGLEYIGRQKLLHMDRAASLWTTKHQYMGEFTLGAVSVGSGYVVDELTEICL